MPTYDYECQECQHQFEELQKMSDPHLINCPQCSKPSLKRLLGSGTGLQFQSSGFYITDYTNAAPASQKECCPCGKNKSCMTSHS